MLVTLIAINTINNKVLSEQKEKYGKINQLWCVWVAACTWGVRARNVSLPTYT